MKDSDFKNRLEALEKRVKDNEKEINQLKNKKNKKTSTKKRSSK